MYLIARDTYKISLREGDDRRSHPGPLRENVTICPTQACTTPIQPVLSSFVVGHVARISGGGGCFWVWRFPSREKTRGRARRNTTHTQNRGKCGAKPAERGTAQAHTGTSKRGQTRANDRREPHAPGHTHTHTDMTWHMDMRHALCYAPSSVLSVPLRRA